MKTLSNELNLDRIANALKVALNNDRADRLPDETVEIAEVLRLIETLTDFEHRAITEDEGFMLEAASQMGFAHFNDEGSMYLCSCDDIITLVKTIEDAVLDRAETFYKGELKEINTSIYAQGAPLGSDTYFKVRGICNGRNPDGTPRAQLNRSVTISGRISSPEAKESTSPAAEDIPTPTDKEILDRSRSFRDPECFIDGATWMRDALRKD